MIEGIPRISVLVITYNQEDVIERALESLLSQKDYIFEICVSDDCSKDRTWDILQDYSLRYPELFVLNQNNPNVGIFENIEKTWGMPSGDIIYQLAGDDECGEGWFKTVVDYILKNNIDYKNEQFCIYGDYKSIYPNGDYMVFCNNLVLSNVDPFYLFMRTLIGIRSTCYSSLILKKFEKVSQGRSHIAETTQEIQLPLYTKQYYYIPYVGNIYYANVGVSTKTNSDLLINERLQIIPYLLSFLESKGIKVDSKFYIYQRANTAEKEFLNHHSIINFIKVVVFKLRSYDRRIGMKSIGLKQAIFALRRRFPHSRPIKITI